MGIFTRFNNTIQSIFLGNDEKEKAVDKKQIKDILENFEDEGSISDLERRMMASVLELEDTTAKEILVPQPDIESIPADMKISKLSQHISDKPHTRYPVVSESKDQVIGFIDIKDIVALNSSKKSNISLSDIARDIPIYPETTCVDEILVSLQEDNKQMAAVIDEWGSLEGIITIEDIIEVIVGDIRDEFDNPDKEPKIEKTGEFYEIDGHVPVRRINRVLGSDFSPHDGAETVAGLLLDDMGEVPEEGDKTDINGFLFEVIKVNDNRISRVKLNRIGS
jgi:CBS domain containing-hemolysin-like protein